MDWKIELNEEKQYILITTNGQFALEEQKDMFQELCGFQKFSPDLPILFDNRKIIMKGSNPDIMRKSVMIVQDFIKCHNVARLAGLVDDGVNFGVGRQFEILTEVVGGNGFRLFKDKNLAVSWLKGEID